MPLTRRELIRAALIGLPLSTLVLGSSVAGIRTARAQADVAPQARVAIGYRDDADGYPSTPPFDPSEAYPEYPFGSDALAGEPNRAYALVREALAAWSPDGAGGPDWSPLAGVIRPGDTVLLKPNLVAPSLGLTTTHISVVRAVIDYVFLATGPSGKILVGEGTASASDWGPVQTKSGLAAMVARLKSARGVPVELVDLNAAPASAPVIDLGDRSALANLNRVWLNLRGGNGRRFPAQGIGRYRMHPAVLAADVLIVMPKMKVHRATGITAAMKNVIGMIPGTGGTKEFPHYSSLEQPGGNPAMFLQNDTIWRVVVDMHRAMLYADRSGRLREQRQRRYLTVIDGLRAGGTDLFSPTSHPIQSIVIADQPLTADAVTARLMGYDVRKITFLTNSHNFDASFGPIDPAGVDVTLSPGLTSLADRFTVATIVPPNAGTVSWKGRIEAESFDAPQLSDLQVEARTGRVRVRARSALGVATVRGEGLDGREPLDRVEGNEQDGVWQTPGPTGATDLVAWDVLFNSARLSIATGPPLG